MTPAKAAAPFLADLAQAATSAQTAEMAFRDNIAREIARLERARQFAFRRLDVARLMTAAASTAKDEEAAIAAQVAVFRSEFGLFGDSEHARAVTEAWKPVAAAVWNGIADTADAPAPAAGVGEAMRAFEDWYEAQFGKNYLSILDHEIPEIPVVEF
ncbi:MAG: hypothetical protein NW205_05580 [Hyphomicrobiaceae bacterium]|nr:hypothetical protein [Hyphomicrobiaceae bacterium]